MSRGLTPSQFDRALKALEREFPEKQMVLVVKKIAFEALLRLIEKTPVKTGRAQGGWSIEIGTIAVKGEHGNAAAALAAGAVKIGSIKKPYIKVFILNAVEYIIYLEEGSSGQAPEGMVAVTYEELKQMFQ